MQFQMASFHIKTYQRYQKFSFQAAIYYFKMALSVNLAIYISLGLFATTTATFSCRDQDGNPVDWFYMYKLPELKDHPNQLVQEGRAFLYLDVNNKQWQLSNKSIQDTDGHPAYYTINQIYQHKSKEDAYYLLYNDEHPPERVSNFYWPIPRGHSKGVQLFDETQGFWLIHSVPKFPPVDAYEYPNSGREYGQSFLCVTYNTSQNLAKIAEQLYYTEPDIYGSYLPSSMAKKYPKLVSILANESVSQAPWNKQIELESLAGQIFTHFGKFREWHKDLYANFVAPSLNQSLYVESWQNGRGDLPAICNQTNKVFTIHTVSIDNVPFTTNKDHSKWCVSTHKQPGEPWICVGDINRQISQFHRSGGTLCLQSGDIWKEYERNTNTYYNCDGQITSVPHFVRNRVVH